MSGTGVLKLTSSVVSNLCVVVGDPARAKAISELLEDSIRVCKKREYYIYTGLYKGVKVTVASHGVGASGANVLFSELIQIGVDVIIRAGTCGTYGPYPRGSHVVASSAVRNDGASDKLIPLSYPASAHFEVTYLLQKIAKDYAKTQENPSPLAVGICNTVANLYGGLIVPPNKMWQQANVIGEDMETSSLFTLGGIHNIKTGAILTVDCDVFDDKESEYNPYGNEMDIGVKRMCVIALDALCELSKST